MNQKGANTSASASSPDTSVQMNKIFVDAHVHIHQCFELPTFFDSALANFLAAARKLGSPDEEPCFILLLTESSSQSSYRHLADLAFAGQFFSTHDGSTWRVEHTSEEGGLRIVRSDGHSLFLLAGSQIATAEKLEVLALLTTTEFEEHQPLSQTVYNVRNAGGLPVIPWGAGKWMGRRGRILKRFLATHETPLFVGDNSGRPFFWPRPRLFSLVHERGGCILPGSDPLPFFGEIKKPGSFGFCMLEVFDSGYPVASMRRALNHPMLSIQAYGKRENLRRFLGNQYTMQKLKRAGIQSTCI